MRRWIKITSIYICILIFCGRKIVDTKKHGDEDTHSSFKVVTVNGSDYRVNDTSKYDFVEHEYIANYKFKNEVDYTNTWLCYYKHKNKYEIDSKNELNLISPSDINIVTYDAFGYKVNDETKYDKKCIGYVLGYNFKDESRCVEVRYNHNIIWKHNVDECGTEYPKSLFVNLYSKIIMIDLTNDWSYFSKIRIDPNSGKEPEESNQNDDTLSNITIITKGEDNRLKENYKKSYDIIKYKHVYEFRFKDNICCTEVKYKNKTVWKFNENEFKNNFPKVIYFNVYAKMILLDLNNNWRYFYKYKQELTGYDNQFTYSSSVSDESPSPAEYKTPDQAIQNYFSYYVNGKETKLITLDIGKSESTDDYDYFVDLETNTSVYIPKEGRLFSMVKRNGSWYSQNTLELWYPNYHDKNNVVYSNRVLIYGSNKKEFNVEVCLINGSKANFDVEFFHVLKNKSRVETLTNLPVSEQPKNITVSVENDNKGYVVDVNKLHDSKLDIKDMTSYDYRFRQDSRCTEFKIDDQLVWKKDDTSENIFPRSIYYHKDLNLVFVEFNLQSFNIYKKINNEWKLVYNNKMKVIALDINTKKSTYMFDYSKSVKVGTYEAKNQYKFKIVKINDNVIWHTNDPDEFAVKVIMDPVATLESIKYVNIFLCNGSTREFHKNGRKWELNLEEEDLSASYKSVGSESIGKMGEKQDPFNPNERQELNVTSTMKQEKPFPDFLKKLKIITADDLEGTNLKENDTGKYQIELNRHSLNIKFAVNSNCIEILYGNVTVWKYGYHSKNTPKNLYVDLNSKMIMINLGDENSISYKYDNNPGKNQQNSFNPPINPSYKPGDKNTKLTTLDLKTIQGTDEFHYFVDYETNTGIYIPKDGYLFSKVCRGESCSLSDNLWESDHYPYCNKILINPINQDMFSLEVSLINGSKVNLDKNSIYPTINSDPDSNKKYLLQSEHPSDVTVVTIDDSDPSKHSNNDISKYVVNKNIMNGSQGSTITSYDYRFRQDSRCTEFKIDDQLVWKKDDTSENIFPRSIYYHKDLNLVFVEFNLQSFNIYKKINNEWKLVYNT